MVASNFAGCRKTNAGSGGGRASFAFCRSLESTGTSPTTSPSLKARSRPRRSETHPETASGIQVPVHDRSLCDGRRSAGFTEFCESSGVHSSGLCSTRLHRDAGDIDAISSHVKVDFELRGCPIDKQQLLEVIASLVAAIGREHQRKAFASHANAAAQSVSLSRGTSLA